MLIYLVSFAAGLLAALSPCVLPVIPILVGSSVSKLKSGPVFLAMGLVFSLVTMGLLFSSAASLLGLSEEQIRIASAVMLLAFGMVLLIPNFKNKFGNSLQPLSNFSMNSSMRHSLETRTGQFLVGALLGGAWSPCVGPTLGIAMTLAATENGRYQAGFIMLLFSVGLTVPLLSIAYGLKGFFQRKREGLVRLNVWSGKIFGASIVLIGMLILTGADKRFESSILANLPMWYLKISSSL